jgi:hypothetical protein
MVLEQPESKPVKAVDTRPSIREGRPIGAAETTNGEARRVAPKLEPLHPQRPFDLTHNERAARAAVIDRRDGPTCLIECTKCSHVSTLQADYEIPPNARTLTALCNWCGSGRLMTLHKYLQVGDRIIAPASSLGVADRHKTLCRLRCEECRTETTARLDPDSIAQRIPYPCKTCFPNEPTSHTSQTITVVALRQEQYSKVES